MLGLANIYIDDGKHNRNEAMQIQMGADIAMGWNMSTEPMFRVIQDFHNLKHIIDKDGIRLPPTFVTDMDDDISYVSPLNDTFVHFGVRNWEGDMLKPGDSLLWPAPNGKTVKLWDDKVTIGSHDQVFDIERNLQTLARHYEGARLSRGVTVTTPFLANIYRDNGVKNVHVYPNSILESDFFIPNLVPHEGVRILWQGSTSHFEDWFPIQDALIKVLKENPQAKLVIYGALWKYLQRNIAPEQLEFHEWSDYSTYKIKRHILDCDINLCPLIDTPFNRSKSALKWYEASIGPRPEATLAAKCGPYLEIEHGKTGLLYDTPEEFATNLQALIKNKELRLTLASHARDWVRSNRDALKTAVPLIEFYESLKAEQRREALAAR
jgi:glycosyltransferase involved in cell wall biosynthesis